MQSNRRHFWRRAAPLGLLTTLVLSACADNAPQDTLSPEGPISRKIDDLQVPVLLIAIGIGVFVYALVLFCVVKFRRRGDDHVPKQVHGHTAAEIGWTIAPALLLLVTGVVSLNTFLDLNEEPANAVDITVIGHQWWWEYHYSAPGAPALQARLERFEDPDTGFITALGLKEQSAPIVTANELHVPIGRPIRLSITSMDVIHSYWAPKLGGKIDAIPGRINKLTIQAEEAKTYFGQCSEFCGTGHADMRLKVVAQSQADFDAWLAAQMKPAVVPVAGTLAAEGKALFEGTAGCTACHLRDSSKPNTQVIDPDTNAISGFIGPNLAHIGSRATFAAAVAPLDTRSLTAWLRDTKSVKQGNRMVIRDLSESEISQLVAYIESLK